MSTKDKVEDNEKENLNEDVIADNNEETTENLTEEKELTEEEKAQIESDRYLRLYSEFENFRKRTQKEKIDFYKTASEDVLKALLPIIDDFERAQKANQTIDDIKAIKEGFTLIHDKLLKTLKQKGLEEIPSSIGEKLDIEKHEAITQIPAPTEEQKGKIIDEVEKGYLLNGKVIRYTKVVVGQ
ncbi:MAG: nucleotide exchange factor GrpE [Flavobacteriales bacterium]|nr:nucleotide exchange factor GrpE [Flavobacteriales bacterium]